MLDGMDDARPMSAAWEERAAEWLAWARTPGHDVYFDRLNWPAFRALLPPPGRLTLDLGCGEGRVGRLLRRAGHRVIGLDSSPTLVRHAREAGGYEQVLQGDAAAVPLPDGAADLVVAFMSLHDMDDPVAALGEAARVLGPGGVLAMAIVHPLNRASEGDLDYFTPTREASTIARAGLSMTFESVARPLEAHTRGLESAGFVIEALREPRADPAELEPGSPLHPAATRPYFLHLRARREPARDPG